MHHERLVLGGFIGPFVTGWIRHVSGGYPAALVTLGCCLAAFGIVVFVFLSLTERRASGGHRLRTTALSTGADL